MQRKTFIRVSALTTIGLWAGLDLFAINTVKPSIISLQEPTLHVRHGLFDLQSPASKEGGLFIQRDVFTKSGLEQVSLERMTSIEIKDKSMEAFGVLNENGFECNSTKISAIKLKKNQSYSIDLKHPSLLFAEIYNLKIDGREIKKDQGIVINQSAKIEVVSEEDQYIILYAI